MALTAKDMSDELMAEYVKKFDKWSERGSPEDMDLDRLRDIENEYNLTSADLVSIVRHRAKECMYQKSIAEFEKELNGD